MHFKLLINMFFHKYFKYWLCSARFQLHNCWRNTVPKLITDANMITKMFKFGSDHEHSAICGGIFRRVTVGFSQAPAAASRVFLKSFAWKKLLNFFKNVNLRTEFVCPFCHLMESSYLLRVIINAIFNLVSDTY